MIEDWSSQTTRKLIRLVQGWRLDKRKRNLSVSDVDPGRTRFGEYKRLQYRTNITHWAREPIGTLLLISEEGYHNHCLGATLTKTWIEQYSCCLSGSPKESWLVGRCWFIENQDSAWSFGKRCCVCSCFVIAATQDRTSALWRFSVLVVFECKSFSIAAAMFTLKRSLVEGHTAWQCLRRGASWLWQGSNWDDVQPRVLW